MLYALSRLENGTKSIGIFSQKVQFDAEKWIKYWPSRSVKVLFWASKSGTVPPEMRRLTGMLMATLQLQLSITLSNKDNSYWQWCQPKNNSCPPPKVEIFYDFPFVIVNKMDTMTSH